MNYGVLGPIELGYRGRDLRLRPMERRLLGVLLLHTNQPISRDRLSEELWGERQPASRHALDMQISKLRTVLRVNGDQPLITLPQGFLLQVRQGELDRDRFERLAERGRQELRAGALVASARTLREALRLWRGTPYADVSYEMPFQVEIERLNEQRLTVLEARFDADLALGRHNDAISDLRALIASHPHRERLWAQLMLAFYRSGRQAEALHTYQICRRNLLDQLGIEPGPALRRIQQSILQQAPDIEPSRPVIHMHGRPQRRCRRQRSRLSWPCCDHPQRRRPATRTNQS
jgi:DNA-binding SARP family transcriptional activator